MTQSPPPFHPRLIVGLGNPGRRYAQTYHNVGALAVRALLAAMGLRENASRRDTPFDYWTGHRTTNLEPLEVRHGAGPGMIIVRPMTFMNESGLAVRDALKKFRVAPEDLMVVHDDSDLALGRTQLAFGRGAAGHHGVQSVIQHIGTNNFWRFRIGIRVNGEKAERFVLRIIRTADKAALYGAFSVFTRKVTENDNP